MNRRITFVQTICLILLPIRLLFAQSPAIVPAKTATADRLAPVDSTNQSRSATDATPAAVRRNGISIGTGAAPTNLGDTRSLDDDTAQVTPKQEAAIRKIIPRQATIRSLILPGMGQAYNRQYYKIPFVYGGFGAVGYFFVRYRRLANEAENGYRRLLYGDVVPEVRITSVPGVPASITQTVVIPARYVKVEEVLINSSVFRTQTQAKAAYDFYRRYRDLNIILSVVLYAVNAVEANVAAHLKTFDLSDDISMRIEPAVLPMPGTGLVPGVRVALTFK